MKQKKANAFKQFLLLLWKNLLLQIRSWILSLLIIILPVAFAGLMVALRTIVDNEVFPDAKTYDPFPVLPWDNYFQLDIPSFENGTAMADNFTVFYYPSNTLIDAVMQQSQSVINKVGFVSIADESELADRFDLLRSQVWKTSTYLGMVEFEALDDDNAGVAWPTDNSMPPHLKMNIRLSYTRRVDKYGLSGAVLDDDRQRFNNWRTGEEYDARAFGHRQDDSKFAPIPPGYFEEGFLSLQLALNLGILLHLGGTWDSSTSEIHMNRIPYPPYSLNTFNLFLNTLLPFVFVISMISLVLLVVKQLVLEKERRLKESMKMMGLRPWLHNVAWMFHFGVIFLVVSFLMTFFLTVKLVDQGAIFEYSSYFGVFLVFMFYSIQALACCFLFSTLFSNANTAAVMTGVIWFFTYFPWLFLDPGNPNGFYNTLGVGIIILLSFIPNLGFCFGVLMLTSLENRGIGVNMDTLTETRTFNDDLMMVNIFTSQIVSAIVFILLTWYLENVHPGIYGVAKSPIFCFKPSYWCPDTMRKRRHVEVVREADHTDGGRDKENFEEDPEGLKVGIHIQNLHKKYGNGKLAVRGVNVKMFEGQTTAFLGHNGAGKTSTISMLTGLYEPSSGDALINGLSIKKDMEKIRESLGICPQHDVLYDNLTVEEHLRLFCKLKGMEGDSISKEITNLLTDLKLTDKRKSMARELSGGMKRKLSVAMAFCGGSKVVILDEPTSGMDPSARRVTWDLIQKYRKGRTIILTTHYMDEADFLGDRIAIMATGKLVCAGTSMFLKNRYGVGYHMVAEKAPGCDPSNVYSFLGKYVPGVEKESDVGAELTFRLPQESSPNFPTLFDELDNQKAKLGVASYGVSVTTLEEVFMRVGHLDEEAEMGNTEGTENEKPPSYSASNTHEASPRHNAAFAHDSTDNIVAKGNEEEHLPAGTTNGGTNGSNSTAVQFNGQEVIVMTSFKEEQQFTPVTRNTGLALFCQQMQALLYKRLINTWRSRALSIAQILVPVLFTLLALLFTRIISDQEDIKPYTFDLAVFDDNIITLYDPNNDFPALKQKYIDSLGAWNTFARDAPDAAENITTYFGESGRDQVDEFNQKYIVGASFEDISGVGVFTAWFNGQPFHSAPLSLQMLMNAVIRDRATGTVPKITAVNAPLPKTEEELEEAADEPTADAFLLSFYMAGMGLGFLMGSFVVFLVREKAARSKHIQMVSGVNTITYWLSTLLWDFCNYLVTVLLLLLLIVAFQLEGWCDEMAGHFILILLLYAWAMLPMMYLLSKPSSVPANGFLVLALINIVGTIGFAIAYYILKALESSGEGIVMFLCLFFPQSSIACALIDANSVYTRNKGARELGLPEEFTYFEFEEGISYYIICFIIDGFVYWFILLLIEYGLFSFIFTRLFGSGQQSSAENDLRVSNCFTNDPDVIEEKARLIRGGGHSEKDVMVIKGIEKTYRGMCGGVQHKAVHGLYAGVGKGECFGLLGVNGAGKSTTFNMLTGDLLIDSGSAFIEGINVATNVTAARKLMGYCPQFDALLDNLTGEETLYMYGRIRGIPSDKMEIVTRELMEALQLTVYAKQQVGTYSGGNKRKMSTAIALIGSPPLVFLDEPSSGMDPVTRRKLWNVLSRVRENGQSLVITSHSMEECEALCTRMTIMVNGQFQCLGGLQRLKSKYGSGFTLICKTRSPDKSEGGGASAAPTGEDTVDNGVQGGPEVNMDARRLKEHIEKEFQGCILKDAHTTGTVGYLHYELNGQTYKWSQLFSTIEKAKPMFNISDYIISQTTLEQIFLNFARSQTA